jgi:arabinogalactan endo-1,4-beta-galactosidase
MMDERKWILPIVAILLPAWMPGLAVGEGPAGTPEDKTPFLQGADLSFLDQLEDSGAVYKQDGVSADALVILRERGLNAVRLRLWHPPATRYNGLARTVHMAKRIRAAGLRFLLDIHYSDSWADPGKQTKPTAWQGLPFATLGDSVYSYTRQTLQTLRQEGVPPDMVQLGNEISQGFLWDEGLVGGARDTPLQWRQFAELLKAAVSGARDALGPKDNYEIMIHTDQGGDPPGAQWFFDGLLREEVRFDLIGLSFYPWWQGSLVDLEKTMALLAGRFHKPIVVVETAYPWTLSWFDDTNNIVGSSNQLHVGYAASPQGQYSFVRDLIRSVRSLPEGLGRGVFYWSPEWIAVPGVGSAWENMTLFDQHGELLPAARAFADPHDGGRETEK